MYHYTVYCTLIVPRMVKKCQVVGSLHSDKWAVDTIQRPQQDDLINTPDPHRYNVHGAMTHNTTTVSVFSPESPLMCGLPYPQYHATHAHFTAKTTTKANGGRYSSCMGR